MSFKPPEHFGSVAGRTDTAVAAPVSLFSSLSPIFWLFVMALLVFTATRLILAVFTGFEKVPLALWPAVFGRGLLADGASLAFLAVPLLLYEALVPNRLRRTRIHRLLRNGWIIFAVFALLFGAAAEFTFWVEFYNRFNFIAVDYLIYTHEVIQNIFESYPIGLILGALALLALLIGWPISRRIKVHDRHDRSALHRLVLLVLAVALPALSLLLFRDDLIRGSNNEFADELAQNGLYTFGLALQKNEIDYDRFYATLKQETANEILKSLSVRRAPIKDTGLPAIGPKALVEVPVPASVPVSVPVSVPGPEQTRARADSRLVLKRQPKHLVLVSVESLSAEFLGTHGSKLGLTPKLDALMAQGVQFDAMFATGTRTVRGLEALSLGVPPVPGQSIVRRDANDNLAMLGNLLSKQGFQSLFVYGGYGYFDNMSAYFSVNGHEVVDRTAIAKEKIIFENAWGVADEVIFDHTLSAIDKTVASGARAFAHVMTTSNHRPYTYPADRIDIASPGGRNGAVKYTDWAIGKFIDDARQKPWFNDTLFVIIADHCSSVAGKVKLPVGDYHIAAMLYGPQFVAPGHYRGVASQIDLPPTLLEALGVQGSEQFFGRSLLDSATSPGPPDRAFISNYQHLGLVRDGVLTILSPKRAIEAYEVDMNTFSSRAIEPKPAHVQEAIAYYQTAARAFKQGALKANQAAGSR